MCIAERGFVQRILIKITAEAGVRSAWTREKNPAGDVLEVSWSAESADNLYRVCLHGCLVAAQQVVKFPVLKASCSIHQAMSYR
jgi:hypothetical protein